MSFRKIIPAIRIAFGSAVQSAQFLF